MARFMVKASEFKNVCKAVNDRKLAELKKEIIEILKKQDEKDVKKAIDYFNSQEKHYTHLEKSLISGKWIQKAGYGVGTVRIWKGKKYKKIAPGKWARVFDKEGRGTNIAIGKLIAKVQKIDNVEDLMAFVMQNKQRFVDENGIDLPVLDKLRAAVDAKNNGGMGSKTNSKPAEKTDEKYDKELVDSWKDDYKDFSTDALKEKIEEYTKVLERAKNDNPSPDQRVAVKQNEHRLKALNELLEEKKNKPAEKKEDSSRYVEMAKDKIEKYAGKKINSNEISDIKILDDGERSGFLTFEFKSGNDKYKMTYDSGFGGEKGGVSIKKIESEESDKGLSKEDMKKLSDEVSDINTQKLYKKITQEEKDKKYDELYKKYFPIEPKIIKDEREKWLNRGDDEITDELKKAGEEQAKKMNDEFLMQKLEEFRNKKPKDIKAANDRDFKFWVLNHIAKRADRGSLGDAMDYFNIPYDAKTENYNKRNELALSILEKEAKRRGLSKEEPVESEAEKTQNRSEAMKGNKNAYKGGHDDEPVHNKVSKNGVYYNFDGFSHGLNRAFRQAKNLPQNIKDNINNSVKRYIDYVDNYVDEGYKNVAEDMLKNPDKYQHMSMEEFNKETGYDKEDVREIVNLKTKIEFADKLRNFNLDETMISKDAEQNFRDEIYPVSLKQNIEEGFLPDQIADIEAQKAAKAEKKENVVKKPSGKLATTNPDKLKPIATNEKIADGKVKMPYSKELSDEIKQLVNTALKDKNAYSRAFLTKVYYENGNLVATDGKALKILKVGELDGIENGSYVDIDNSKDGITITKDEDFTKNYKYPNYNRVLPDNNKEKIVLDNKALLSKIRELKKDGSITGKDSYVTFDIKGNDLMLDGVKVGDVSAAKFDDDEGANFFNMDVNILTPYLKGESSELISSPNNEKAMYIGDESTINVIMPQNKWTYRYDSNGNQIKEIRRKDYDSQRASKAQEDEIKANRKAALKQVNQEYVDDTINRVKQSINKPGFADKMVSQLSEWKTEHLKNLYKQAKVDVDHLMETKDFLANTFGSYTNKHFNTSPSVLIAQNYAMKQFPQIVKEIERLLTERGEKIEKSLFDDFIVDVFEADEDEEFEEDKENESLFNDYSAEQPELFNSTEMKVQEAFNRCGCCL